jgi:hypothetical protein
MKDVNSNRAREAWVNGERPFPPPFPKGKGATPSVRWTSPPNTTIDLWYANLSIESSDLPPSFYFGDAPRGETRRWAFTVAVQAPPLAKHPFGTNPTVLTLNPRT